MVVMEQVNDFLVGRFAGEFVDVITTINELADVAAHVAEPGIGGNDSFESFAKTGRGFGHICRGFIRKLPPNLRVARRVSQRISRT